MGPSKSDIAFAVHIIGGIDDRSSPEQYRFQRQLDPFALRSIIDSSSPHCHRDLASFNVLGGLGGDLAMWWRG